MEPVTSAVFGFNDCVLDFTSEICIYPEWDLEDT